MLWQHRHVEVLRAAMEDARGGQAAAVTVLGESGMGKTSLLREVVRRASGFNVLEAGGEETAFREPFGLLRYLGVDDVRTPAGGLKEPPAVAQGLRDQVDRLSSGGPVLIVVDDLQWADQESIESLYWLLHRAHADRLLVVLGSRPESADSCDAWRRLVGRASRRGPIVLPGLSLEQATAMVAAVDPSADGETITRLREHTGGNPFHLNSLLRQYGFAELAAMGALPAPAELAKRVNAQLATLGPDAEALAHASAVLGYTWQDLATLAAVGGVQDPAGAAEASVRSGLFVSRGPEAGAPLRASHALVRAAIYQAIPYPRRRELHLRAAGQVGGVMASMEHRFAASGHYDDALADELDKAAEMAHGAGEFGQAGQLLRWSSRRTTDPHARNRRWLDAAFDLILARDIAAVRAQLPAVRSSPDLARRALIQGLMHGVEKRWLDAWSAYTSVSAVALSQADPRTRYRLAVLTAWSVICAGRELEELAPLLGQAARASADRALAGNEIFARGILGLRRGDTASLTDAVESIPARSPAAPLQLTYQLAWRGSIHAFFGHAAAAEADLAEVTTRIRTGVADNGDGVYSGLLAFTRWQSGAWNLARVDMGIALDSAVGQPHPMNRAIEPMLLAVRGDLERADVLLRAAEDVLAVMPWRQAVYLHVISYVARQHAGADPRAQKAALPHLRTVFGDNAILTVPGFTGALWIFHLAIAAIWAGDLELAERFIRLSERQPRPPGWMAWVPWWLRGLVAETAGSIALARDYLNRAVLALSDTLPLYRAHVLADHARLAGVRGDEAAAGRSAGAARQLYNELGAFSYLERLTPETAPAQWRAAAGVDVLSALSDRERDVATLLLGGLTYAQIARDLYITRATVGFHTSRIYAKTGVASRAGLIDLARRNSGSLQN